MEYHVEIAARMLGLSPEEVPVSLLERLNAVHQLCVNEGGHLNSRQAVAIVVEQWRREEINRL